jgi:hypothetical protein
VKNGRKSDSKASSLFNLHEFVGVDIIILDIIEKIEDIQEKKLIKSF